MSVYSICLYLTCLYSTCPNSTCLYSTRLYSKCLCSGGLERKKFLLKQAFDALPVGGAVICVDNLIDDERREATLSLAMSLNMLIEFGRCAVQMTRFKLQLAAEYGCGGVKQPLWRCQVIIGNRQ
ncbi:hypothetical protein DUNSADRAFT_10721 [Dunaliella salina]|uniref:Uncharacterized protein n=1 Tax=Dunaliella salina TaxID=3046 RepID=A0ABQ7FTT9_DUNSA|nr:hypothetical protein DUNSADRAFT_10721 [Dunaliella salina]|eukprot:KAF5825387.1 hypothetical protein DUNSADRAFT_10721 [Dunaliella salina]